MAFIDSTQYNSEIKLNIRQQFKDHTTNHMYFKML